MKQFTVVRRGAALGVVVDSDLLPRDRSVVVIPLLDDLPRAGALNPVLPAAGRERVLHPRAIAALRRDGLEDTGESLEGRRDAIIRAVDVLLGGV